MVTRNKIKNLERELEKINPKKKPTIFCTIESIERFGIKNSTQHLRIGYYDNGEAHFLPDAT